MSETTALGAAMAAGAAEGVNVWNLSSSHLPKVTCETYEPQINLHGEELAHEPRFPMLASRLICDDVPSESEFRFARWKKAVQRSMNWETTEPPCCSNGTRFFRLKCQKFRVNEGILG